MKYFEFKYIETKDGQVVNQGEALYYTSDEQNEDEMKDLSRTILKNPSAVVNILLITKIDRATFMMKGGNPNAY
jgi:hypothetical protein